MRNREILDSWKAISDYLDRDIRTCARWEKELGLPIHRIDQESSRSKVFAYKSEIDEWLKDKANHKEIRKKAFFKRKWVIAGSGLGFALLLIISTVLYFSYRKYSSTLSENLSIAVLPFESSNFTEYEQYIPEGISNEITSSLSRLNNLKVIPATSFASGNNPIKNLKDISEKLNVNHILKTSLEKNENKLKICVLLVRIKDEKVIWSFESEDQLENVFSILDETCQEIHKRLNPDAQTSPFLSFNKEQTRDYAAFYNYLKGNHILSRSNPENDDPWKLYRRGKYYQGKWTRESNDFAISLFSKAIEIDENFAKAYVGLARCYTNYVNFNWDYTKEWLNKAEELLKKAETIYPECPEYYSALIQVYLLKYLCFDENTKNKAFKLAQETIQKYPGHSQLFAQVGYCYYLQFGELGNESDFDKALELNEENYYLHPYHINNIVFTELLMLNKEFDKALNVCNGIQGGESSLMADFRKGEIYYYMGDLDKSEAVFLQFENVSDLNFRISSLFHLGMIAAQRGNTDEIERIVQKISVIAPKEFNFFEDKLKLASLYMGIGKKESGYGSLEAFFNREKTDKSRYIYLKYIDIDKNFENFREEERFKSIINKIGGMK